MSWVSGPGINPDLSAPHDAEIRRLAVAAVRSGSMSLLSAAAWYRVQLHELDSRLTDDGRVAGEGERGA